MRSIRDVKSKSASDGEMRSLRDDIGELSEKYADKSEDELLYALKQSVATAKRDGTFSAEQLDGFVRFVSAGMDANSREKLLRLAEMIKSE